MKHAIGCLGRYERGFKKLATGVPPEKADGSRRDIDERPKNVDGIWFGYMEVFRPRYNDNKPTGQTRYLAVRLQFGEDDIILEYPVLLEPQRHTDGKGFGPKPLHLETDTAVFRLLEDILTLNPWQTNELKALIKKAGLEEKFRIWLETKRDEPGPIKKKPSYLRSRNGHTKK